MASLFNQFSFLAVGLALLVIIGLLLRGRGMDRRRGITFAGFVLIMITAWVVLHPRGTVFDNPEQVRAQIGAGRPVLLEFQSPY